jgi:hypothetical protein
MAVGDDVSGIQSYPCSHHVSVDPSSNVHQYASILLRPPLSVLPVPLHYQPVYRHVQSVFRLSVQSKSTTIMNF